VTQYASYDFLWFFVTTIRVSQRPATWWLIDVSWLKRLISVSSYVLALSQQLMPNLRTEWTSQSINRLVTCIRASHVIACKLGSILFDGDPVNLTHVYLYERDLNSLAIFGTFISSVHESISSLTIFHMQHGVLTHACFIYLHGFTTWQKNHHQTRVPVLLLYRSQAM